MDVSEELIYTPSEAARQLHISTVYLRQLAGQGIIEASLHTPGGQRRYTADDIQNARERLKAERPKRTIADTEQRGSDGMAAAHTRLSRFADRKELIYQVALLVIGSSLSIWTAQHIWGTVSADTHVVLAGRGHLIGARLGWQFLGILSGFMLAVIGAISVWGGAVQPLRGNIAAAAATFLIGCILTITCLYVSFVHERYVSYDPIVSTYASHTDGGHGKYVITITHENAAMVASFAVRGATVATLQPGQCQLTIAYGFVGHVACLSKGKLTIK